MKKILNTKRLFVAASLFMAVSLESAAQYPLNNVWLRADVYPAGAGKVFVDWGLDEVNYQSEYSEFKRSTNAMASTAFILAKPSEGYQFAGVARDTNHNGQYDNNYLEDRLVHVWANHYFDCFYDHTNYLVPGSNSDTEELAEEALNAMTTPTDQVYAVFTKGAVAHRAKGEESHGYVYASKLDNKAGDEVTFFAYGDYEDLGEGNVYYKFDYWSDANGTEVSRNREFTTTVQGGELYYAHFAVTTKADYRENEQRPDIFKYDYNNPDWNPAGIQTVSSGSSANNAVYDLQGRRVAQPGKGLFIRDGKKFVIK